MLSVLSGRRQIFREALRDNAVLVRARKGRSINDGASRHQKFWEASVPPRLAEEVFERVSGADEVADAPAALNAEILECQNVREVLDIISEEAAIMTGANASLALMRLVNMSKSQLHQLRNNSEFAKLLSALERHIDELRPKELAQSLWSLAKTKCNRPKLLRRLADRASMLVAEFNQQDLSTIVWAFGSLQYNPGKALLDAIAAATFASIHEFQPQGLSMLTWGYGKLDHVPAGELLDQIVSNLEENMSLYNHQAVSNMFYSLARLDKYSPFLCSAVETHVISHMEDFSTQEMMNVLWAFAKFRFVPQQFIRTLLEHVQDDSRAHAYRPSDWAALIWGLASFGLPVSAEAMAAINSAALQHLPSMNVPELCNIMWGLSILDECRQPLFAEGMRHVLDRQQQRSLEPRLLRQLLQASALAEAAGVPVSLPQTVEKAAAKWWSATANKVPSLTHDSVSRTLKRLGVKHRVLVFLGEGLPTVDIALEVGADQENVAIQVVGPHEVSANTGELLGRAKAEARLLSANAWRPIHLIVSTFSDTATQQARSIVRQLQKEGLQVRVPEGDRPGLQRTPRGSAGHSSGQPSEGPAQRARFSSSGSSEGPLVVGRDGVLGRRGGAPTAKAEFIALVGSSGPGLLSIARC